MPRNTFFCLPEEKRQRLTGAAWQEFTRVSFADASINRIVQEARIPRGSFYQYFTDKEDLFSFLLRGLGSAFWELLEQELQAHSGDLPAALLSAFDSWFLRRTVPACSAFRVQLLLLKNPWLDWGRIVFPGPVPSFPRRIRTSLAAPSSAPESTGLMEAAGILAVAAFIGICKQCLFMPEEASALRQKLLQIFWLSLAAPPAEASEY